MDEKNQGKIAGDLREQRNFDQSLLSRPSATASSPKSNLPEYNSETEPEKRQAVLNEQRNQAIKQQAEQLKAEDGEKRKRSIAGLVAKKITGSASSKATAELLKQSWLNLLTSFGGTLLWIDLHFIMNRATGDEFFCKPGHEWVPKEVAEAGGPAAEAAGKKLEAVESCGCCLVNGCLGVVLIIGLMMIGFVAWVIFHPIDVVFSVGTSMLDSVKGWFSWN